MKIILLDKLLKFKNIGNKINIKSGYANNFLIPKGIAINYINKKKTFLKNIINKNLIKNKKIIKIYFFIECDKNGNLYSTLGYKQIINLINFYNIKIEKKFIYIKKTIKKIGNYIIKINLYNNLYNKLYLKIFKKNNK
ncbi:hypothetical protein SSAmo_1430 [Enterobacterales bacterium endosymbiont of Anomoneura mori]|uniref:50S ribosomal protein L9 n=1 Tax=Enterobacterales bacterium endosymbiont of Anomoneura mori TaxID=3132096 RepID=UPI00399CED62